MVVFFKVNLLGKTAPFPELLETLRAESDLMRSNGQQLKHTQSREVNQGKVYPRFVSLGLGVGLFSGLDGLSRPSEGAALGNPFRAFP